MALDTDDTKRIPEGARAMFMSDGYAIFPGLIGQQTLTMLRQVCDTLLREPPDDDKGGKAHDIGRGHDRRFLRHRHQEFSALSDFVLGRGMKAIARELLDAPPYLFNEQFVVKGPRTGASFAWHQDGGYVPFDHAPYLTVWIALDDTTVENGAVYVLPRDLNQGQDIYAHRWDAAGKEKVGYDGDDPGIAATVQAGSVVAFSSATLHRSSPNTTDRARRAYLAQYSPEPILDPESGLPRTFATPL